MGTEEEDDQKRIYMGWRNPILVIASRGDNLEDERLVKIQRSVGYDGWLW